MLAVDVLKPPLYCPYICIDAGRTKYHVVAGSQRPTRRLFPLSEY